MTLVFCYGTLKRGEPNHEEFQKRDARFISEATTVEKWPLIVASNLNMPFLLNQKGLGKSVSGELYSVDDQTLVFLDWFEGVSDSLYSVFKIDVRENTTGKVHSVPAYLLDNFKPELLESRHFFESYSSVNEFYGEYKKDEDSLDETLKLLKQVKNGF